jgi:hypothetical protein
MLYSLQGVNDDMKKKVRGSIQKKVVTREERQKNFQISNL